MRINRDNFYTEEENSPTFDLRKSNANVEKWTTPNR